MHLKWYLLPDFEFAFDLGARNDEEERAVLRLVLTIEANLSLVKIKKKKTTTT
jgi:hypothetical protein